MMIDDILVDPETACLQIGEKYIFSDSFMALKKYDRKLSVLENNKKNESFGFVFEGKLTEIIKYGNFPYVFEYSSKDSEKRITLNSVFVGRL